VAALARLVSGRRSKWLVIAAWIAGVLAMAGPASRLHDVTTDDVAGFLPQNAESTHVQRLLRDRFPGGDAGTGLIVYHRAGGLQAADAARIRRDAARIRRAIPAAARPVVPFTPGTPRALLSHSGDTAYTLLHVPQDFRRAAAWGKDARDVVKAGTPPGLHVYVTGDLGFSADVQEVFADMDARLLAATVALVLVLLGAIYRSPTIAIVPIVVVGLATVVADGLIYAYANAAGDVSSNATTILVVLVFGVGTDYCLLLVARYREELRRVPDEHVAMERALRRAGPALLASGCTVIAAMLVLLLAEVGSTRGLGPVSAIGVAAVLLAGLTLLPALLTIAGRRGFWPLRSRVAHRPAAVAGDEAGIWRRVGDRVLERPAAALAATVALFGVLALGLLSYREDYSIAGTFRTHVESVTGFQVLRRAFPAGALGPTAVIVRRTGGRVTARDVAEARRRLRAVDGVAAVGPPQPSADGRLARLDVVFRDDPTPTARSPASRCCAAVWGTSAPASGDSSAPAAPSRRTSTRRRSATWAWSCPSRCSSSA
jgi:RND superfamily putative drug exporter